MKVFHAIIITFALAVFVFHVLPQLPAGIVRIHHIATEARP